MPIRICQSKHFVGKEIIYSLRIPMLILGLDGAIFADSASCEADAAKYVETAIPTNSTVNTAAANDATAGLRRRRERIRDGRRAAQNRAAV